MNPVSIKPRREIPEVRLVCVTILLAVCLALASGCQTNPLSSRVSLVYESTQTGDDQHKLLKVDGESGLLADDVSAMTAAYSLETSPDGSSKLTIKLNGDKKTDTGNQFKALDSIIGFLVGVFAGGVTP